MRLLSLCTQPGPAGSTCPTVAIVVSGFAEQMVCRRGLRPDDRSPHLCRRNRTVEARGRQCDRRRSEWRGSRDRVGRVALEAHAKRTGATLCAWDGARGRGAFYDVLLLIRSVKGYWALVTGNIESLFSRQCPWPIDH